MNTTQRSIKTNRHANKNEDGHFPFFNTSGRTESRSRCVGSSRIRIVPFSIIHWIPLFDGWLPSAIHRKNSISTKKNTWNDTPAQVWKSEQAVEALTVRHLVHDTCPAATLAAAATDSSLKNGTVAGLNNVFVSRPKRRKKPSTSLPCVCLRDGMLGKFYSPSNWSIMSRVLCRLGEPRSVVF
jgi:hypothetical protein